MKAWEVMGKLKNRQPSLTEVVFCFFSDDFKIKISDNNIESLENFTSFLNNIENNLLFSFIEECKTIKDSALGFILQELVHELFRRFGFDVCRGNFRKDIDGMYILKDNYYIVEIKKDGESPIKNRFTEYKENFLKKNKNIKTSSFLLICLENTESLFKTINENCLKNEMVVVSVDLLIELYKLFNNEVSKNILNQLFLYQQKLQIPLLLDDFLVHILDVYNIKKDAVVSYKELLEIQERMIGNLLLKERLEFMVKNTINSKKPDLTYNEVQKEIIKEVTNLSNFIFKMIHQQNINSLPLIKDSERDVKKDKKTIYFDHSILVQLVEQLIGEKLIRYINLDLADRLSFTDNNYSNARLTEHLYVNKSLETFVLCRYSGEFHPPLRNRQFFTFDFSEKLFPILDSLIEQGNKVLIAIAAENKTNHELNYGYLDAIKLIEIKNLVPLTKYNQRRTKVTLSDGKLSIYRLGSDDDGQPAYHVSINSF